MIIQYASQKSIKQAYLQFLNTEYGADIYNDFKQILYSPDDTLIEHLNANILSNICETKLNKMLRICDVGGGDGKRISRIIKYLFNQFNIKCQLDFIEQSSVLCQRFKKYQKNQLESIETKIHNNLFENVELSNNYYDLIFFIHSIFAFEDSKAIDKILTLPNDSGTIIIISNSPDSFLGGLKELVDEDYHDRRYEINDLLKELDQRQINYHTSFFSTEWSIDINDYQSSLNTILTWISLDSYYFFGDDKKQKINDYVQQKTVFLDNRAYFVEKEFVLTIT